MATLLILALNGCGRKEAHTDEHGAEPQEETGHSEDIVLTADAAKIAGIETGEARMMSIQGQLRVQGVVTNSAHGRAVVTPPVAGRIARLHVKIGDKVRMGDPIATLQSPELAQAAADTVDAQRGVILAESLVKDARGRIDLANAKLRTANQMLSRQKQFASVGAFSQPALQAAQRELNEAEAELEGAKQEEVVHQAQLERAERLYKQELISRTELEQARLELQMDKIRQDKARRQIELSKATFEREQKITSRGLMNSREIQAAEAEVRAANLEVKLAQMALRAAGATLESEKVAVHAARTTYAAMAGGTGAGGTLIVRAPIGGVVTHRDVTLGQAAERTTEICQIENLSTVWVTANVPEKDIEKARIGGTAQITVASYRSRTFTGVVQVVGSRLDPKTRSMPVQVLVENADGALRSDMFASVSLGQGASSMALVVPRSAVIEDGDRKLVYIDEDGGKYEERAVLVGRTQGEFVEVIEGLATGDRVVTKGGFVLKSEKAKAELKGHEH